MFWQHIQNIVGFLSPYTPVLLAACLLISFAMLCLLVSTRRRLSKLSASVVSIDHTVNTELRTFAEQLIEGFHSIQELRDEFAERRKHSVVS